MEKPHKSKLEVAVEQYWLVSASMKHPAIPAITTSTALQALGTCDLLVYTARSQRTIKIMETLREVIIIGASRKKVAQLTPRCDVLPLKKIS